MAGAAGLRSDMDDFRCAGRGGGVSAFQPEHVAGELEYLPHIPLQIVRRLCQYLFSHFVLCHVGPRERWVKADSM